ncbi:hypothetical protein FRB99_004391 [Tulasnella sp. 403]|nr:hypothetical protein FRB99_004391 [Tulasnella sp. 403]
MCSNFDERPGLGLDPNSATTDDPANAKKIASDNERALRNLRYGAAVCATIYVILRLLWRAFPPSRKQTIIFLGTLVPELLLSWHLHTIGTPRRDKSGTLIGYGEDLNQPGLIDAYWDVIYMTWGCQVGSSLLGDWFWWLYFLIPVFALYKVYTTFIQPMLALRSGAQGGAAPQEEEQKETVSKRQTKIQKRNERLQSMQQKPGRR